MKRLVNGLGKLNWIVLACTVITLCTITATGLPAQTTFTSLYSFCTLNCADGEYPVATVVQATNGNLYGTTNRAGSHGFGTVFKITPSGTLTTVHSFVGEQKDGEYPFGLIQAADGNVYGITRGGANNSGLIFKIAPGGALTTFYRFCSQLNCADGESPSALVQATDGNFYGTTSGGAIDNSGTVFKITPSGTLTTLYSFCSEPNCADGANATGLIQGTDGNFYGTTYDGGFYAGTVFKITPGGTLTTLHRFCSESLCSDGQYPQVGLVQATDGDFYGTTTYGGAYSPSYGTIFKITPDGTLTTLYSFDNTDGAYPEDVLVQATDGDLYGTTSAGGGGIPGNGTIFKMTLSGTLTPLHSFDGTDGSDPYAGLVQTTDGAFYGTTSSGGANGHGTVFRLSAGLGPFVETLPTSGKAGAKVILLGTNLTGTSSVTFNGAAATFNVNATGTAIATRVPAGATTGTVQVVTPGGMLSSNAPFRVP